jgi:hypothetical protein
LEYLIKLPIRSTLWEAKSDGWRFFESRYVWPSSEWILKQLFFSAKWEIFWSSSWILWNIMAIIVKFVGLSPKKSFDLFVEYNSFAVLAELAKVSFWLMQQMAFLKHCQAASSLFWECNAYIKHVDSFRFQTSFIYIVCRLSWKRPRIFLQWYQMPCFILVDQVRFMISCQHLSMFIGSKSMFDLLIQSRLGV